MEGDETLQLKVELAAGSVLWAEVAFPETVTVTIVDGDAAGTFSWSAAESQVAENHSASLAITRTGGTANQITLLATPTGITASAGNDFAAAPVQVTFPAGVVARLVSIPALKDALTEGNETFSVTLSLSHGSPAGAALGEPTVAMVTILDVPNNAPVANSRTLITSEDTQVSFTLTGQDAQEDSLSFTVLSSPAHGALNGSVPNLVFTPNANFNGTDSFTYKVNDGSLDSPPATISIVVNPVNDPPIAQCRDVTVNADANGSANASIENSSNGIDADDTITLTQTPPGPYPVGVTTVTLTVTDSHGASSTCSSAVTVIDNTPPSLTVPAPIVVNNNLGICGAVVSFSVSATDNCSVANVVSAPASGSTFPKGTTTVTTVATDAAGNQTSKTFTVTVNDTEAPSLTVPAPIIVSNDTGQCSAVVSFTVTATDNCPGVTVVNIPASGSVFVKGTTTVTSVATDASGNPTTRTFTVTVNDTEAPSLTIPAPTVVHADAEYCEVAVSFTVTATDNCSGVTVVSTPASGSVFPLGTTTVTGVATDAAGNKTTKTFTVRVKEHVEIGNAVVVARNSVWIKQKAVIHSGDINVNSDLSGPYLNEGVELSIGQDAVTPAGFALRANRITLRQKAVVNGDVVFNELEDSQKSTVNGLQHSPLPLPVFCNLPAFQTAPAGTQDIAPKQGETVTLRAGSYRDVVLKQKSTLILAGGEYNLRNLDIGQNVDVLFRAPSVVRIAERFALDQKSILGPDAGSGIGANDIVLYVTGINGKDGKLNGNPDAAKIGQDCVVRANFYVPNGTLSILQKSSATGAFVARDLMVGENAELTLDSAFGPVSSSGAGLLGLGAGAEAVERALPRLMRLQHATDGAMELRFTGRPGSAYSVEASQDLETWKPLGRARVGREDLIRFMDPAAQWIGRRFYRLIPNTASGDLGSPYSTGR